MSQDAHVPGCTSSTAALIPLILSCLPGSLPIGDLRLSDLLAGLVLDKEGGLACGGTIVQARFTLASPDMAIVGLSKAVNHWAATLD